VGRASLADKQIKAAQETVMKRPATPDGYNLLADAFMEKARETGDFSLNAQAEEALARSEKAGPGNYEALKLRAKLLLTYHRFSEALEVSRRAQHINPTDHDVYGAMTDAFVELGDYNAAIETAQKMIDLRPDTASYSRVSYLRALHGDNKGAIEMMRLAADSANPANVETVAWCRVHLGDELINAGRLTDAEREYDRALFVFPGSHLALAAKARARLTAGDTEAAVNFYERAMRLVPLPEYAAALGDLYAKLGRKDDAKKQYELVEFVERTGAAGGTYSRTVALFHADHDTNLDQALDAATRERAARRDVYTCDVLAWCLYKKGRYAEAKTASDEALRIGTRDARLLYHAGMIAYALGDRRGSASFLEQALRINPSFDVLQAQVARKTLKECVALVDYTRCPLFSFA
jgi:tetratricopeptide (TPR) repeat protein